MTTKVKSASFLLIFVFLVIGGKGDPFILNEKYQIDLSLPPEVRYSEIAKIKKQPLLKFIQHLSQNKHYKSAFKYTRALEPILSHLVQKQFYLQCKSIATVLNRPTSEIVVFNYMYELGACSKFCTSISLQNNNQYFLARNLDYGYQEYLLNNSAIFQYVRDGRVVVKVVGHAGFVGLHTGMRINQYDRSKNYALSFNQRIEGGFRRTLAQIFSHKSQPMNYFLKKALLAYDSGQQIYPYLLSAVTCAPAYFILNFKNNNILIEKSRVGSQAFFRTSQNYSFMLQTNTDLELPDPDGRRDIATSKIQKLFDERKISRNSVVQVLSEAPNKNNLTILTVVMEPMKEEVLALGWFTQEQQQENI